MDKIFKKTKALVIAGLILSCLSYFTSKKGWSEIYPFFFWKLYSQPYGWNLEYTSYRIYAKKTEDTDWVRLKNVDRATFNKDEHLYFLNHVAGRLDRDQTIEEREKDLKKAKIYCQYIAPEYDDYKIVGEVLNPLELEKDSTAYVTRTIVEIP